MLTGWLAGGIAPLRFTVLDPAATDLPRGVARIADASEAADRRFDALLLAVKPQQLGAVAAPIEPLAGPDTTVLSIMAGVELGRLAQTFPRAGGVVRIMPNLAAAIGKSPVALAARGIDRARRAQVTALMRPLGVPEWLDEAQFDAVTALAGSGPAFVYRFIDSLGAGGAALGLGTEQAQRLALAMIEGAALLAATSPHAPGELAKRVASPGGTTEAGLAVLDHDRALALLVEAALRAAAGRSAELAPAALGLNRTAPPRITICYSRMSVLVEICGESDDIHPIRIRIGRFRERSS